MRAASHHARYMYHAGVLTHYENPSNRWYTKDGNQAAAGDEANGSRPFQTLTETAYHQNVLIDPEEVVAGFGSYNGYDSYTAVWSSAKPEVNGRPAYEFPGRGLTTRYGYFYAGGELPDPFASCPSIFRTDPHPRGLPLEYGHPFYSPYSGPLPRKASARLSIRGTSQRICVKRYGNASILIPLHHLRSYRTYHVAIWYAGVLQARWYFKTGRVVWY